MGLISFYYFSNECSSVLLALRRSNLASLFKHDFLSFTTCKFQLYVSNIINKNANTEVLIKARSSFQRYIQGEILKITEKEKKWFDLFLVQYIEHYFWKYKLYKVVISDHAELGNTYCYASILVLFFSSDFPRKENIWIFFQHNNIVPESKTALNTQTISDCLNYITEFVYLWIIEWCWAI